MDYSVELEPQTGILVCRIMRFLDEPSSVGFGEAIHDAMIETRRTIDPLRVLFDNRYGYVTPSAAANAMMERMRRIKRTEDRTAIIVSGSLAKPQAKRTASVGHEFFISEDAARLWLQAYVRT